MGHIEEGEGVMPKEEDLLQQFNPKLRRRTMLKVSRSSAGTPVSIPETWQLDLLLLPLL